MASESLLSSDRERRLNEVLAAFLEADEAGHAPDRAEIMKRHPDLARELAEFFANRDQFASLADPFGTQAMPPPPTITPSRHVASSATPRFGDYELLHEIARGGMGVVYRARQVSLNREVALKMIMAGQTPSANTLRRFQIEAEAAAQLDHPNIVPIYHVGELAGQPFFTMKLIEGGSLASRLDDFRLPLPAEKPHMRRSVVRQRLDRLTELLATVARAVHHAHQRSILHRDLKPGNILLNRKADSAAGSPVADTECPVSDLEPLVADFGLAKRFDGDNSLTQPQTIVGTATYMAPEQARPGKDPLTTAADVYALGAILYELLTGQPPLVGETYFNTLIKVVEDPPVPPSQRNPHVPRDLEAICLKCLQKSPGQRYGSALALAEDLERWRTGDAISLRTQATRERMWRWARRNRLSAVLLAAVALLLVGTAIGSLIAVWRITAARDLADHSAREAELSAARAAQLAEQERGARRETEIALTAAQNARAENHRLLVAGYVANGSHALDGGDLFGALVWYGEALRQDKGDAAKEEPHRVRLATVLRRCPRLVQVWFGAESEGAPSLSPDGRRVLRIQGDTARVWDVANGNAVSAPLKHAGDVTRAAFSPNGTRVVTASADGSAQMWDAVSGRRINRPFKHDKAVTWAAFSPDASRVATVSADHHAKVWDAASGKLLFGHLEHTCPLLFASFSRDGKHLITCGGDPDTHHGELRVWDLSGTKPVAKIFHRKAVLHFAFLTPDGSSVVACGAWLRPQWWPLSGTRKESHSIPDARLDPDGLLGADPTRVVSLHGSTAQVYDLLTGQPVAPPMLHGGEVSRAVFSPDGRFVATAASDRTVHVWDALTGKPLSPPLRHARVVRRVSFSGDGHRLLTTSWDGQVRVWDLTSRELVQPLAPRPAGNKSVTSSDGLRVAATDKDGAVWVIDALTTKVLHGPWKLQDPITELAFSPDGQRLLAAGAHTARVWDTVNGEAVSSVLSPKGPIQRAQFTPDGSRIALLGANDFLQLYDGARGTLQFSHVLPPRGDLRGIPLTPDGRAIVISRNRAQYVELVDVKSSKPRAGPFRHTGLAVQAAVSPDGKYLALATGEGTAYLWDIATIRPSGAPLLHGPPLRQLAFSGDGRRLATLAEDGTARVWDVAAGQPITPLLRSAEPLNWLHLAADGNRLVARAKNGAGFVWDLQPDRRPVDDLVRLTQLFSGQALDGRSGGLEPVEMASLLDLWPTLRGKYPQEFTPATP
jgi:WD40 repeat protein